MPSSNQAQTKAEIQAKHMNKDVIQVPFGGVAASKLHDLFERGYTVCGVAIQRIHQSGNFDRGAITTGGMVMWWQKLFSGDEFEASNVQQPSNALQLAEALHEMANTYLPTGGDFMPPPRSKADELIDDAAAELRRQHARIAELEAQLYAVGAGGVGQSIKPQIQADTAQEPGTGIPASVPTGWKLVPVEPTDDMFIEGMEADCRGRPSIDDDNHVRSIWRAMLSSAPDAPPPPAAQQEPVPVAVASMPHCRLEWLIGDTVTADQVAEMSRQGIKLYAAPQPPVEQEPFGYFKVNPFGWTDCDKTDDGAVALYTATQPAKRMQLTRDQIANAWIENGIKDCDITKLTDFMRVIRAVEAAVNESQQ